ncbi:MAG: TonB-dependent receptor [Desulfobulbaceae bacterium]
MRRARFAKRALFSAGVFLLVSTGAWAQNTGAKTKEAEAKTKETETEADAPVIVPPVLEAHIDAPYPEDALRDGVAAEVVLAIDIDEHGAVEAVSVLTPADPPGYGFDEAALKAAEQFVFSPATEDGVPIPVRIAYRYGFALPAAPSGESDPTDDDARDTDDTDAPAAAPRPDPVINFRGVLKERGTRLPISGTTVTLFRDDSDEAWETLTDADGAFAFADLTPGDWKVFAHPPGYYPLRTTDHVAQGARTDATYHIEKADYNPYDVLVEGDQIKKEVSRTTLATREIEKIPGTFGDVMAVVQNLPGVARANPLTGQIVVRGSSPEDTQVFIDGVAIPIIYHFGGFRSVIPLGMLDKLDFYPGNFTAEFGRGTGGIVDVGIKRLRPAKIGGYVDLNLIDAGVYLEAPIGDKFALAAAVRRSYIDAIMKGVVPDDAGVNLLAAPRYYDYQFLASWHPNPRHELQVFVFGSDDRFEVVVDNPANLSPLLRANDAATSTTFYRTVLSYRFAPSERFHNTLKISAGHNWVYLGLGDQFFLDTDTYVAQIHDAARIHLSPGIALVTGVDYLLSRSDVSLRIPQFPKEGETANIDPAQTRTTTVSGQYHHYPGFFLQLEARFFDRLTLIPGVRFDYFARVDTAALGPRFNARFDLTEKWRLKAGVGLYHQEPSFDETDPVLGNPALGLESAVHYAAGFEYRPWPHVVVDATGFVKTMRDLVSRSDELVTRDGHTVPRNYANDGAGLVYGLELLLRHDLHRHFSGWVSYTLSQALRKDAPGDDWRDFDFNQAHILAVVGAWHLPRNWGISGRWRLVSGNPYTPIVGSIYNVEEAGYRPVYGASNSKTYPPFHQLDVRIDKRWVYRLWILEAYLDVQNIYNSPNTTGYSHNYDYSQRRPQQGLPILPVIGLKGEF